MSQSTRCQRRDLESNGSEFQVRDKSERLPASGKRRRLRQGRRGGRVSVRSPLKSLKDAFEESAGIFSVRSGNARDCHSLWELSGRVLHRAGVRAEFLPFFCSRRSLDAIKLFKTRRPAVTANYSRGSFRRNSALPRS